MTQTLEKIYLLVLVKLFNLHINREVLFQVLVVGQFLYQFPTIFDTFLT